MRRTIENRPASPGAIQPTAFQELIAAARIAAYPDTRRPQRNDRERLQRALTPFDDIEV